MSNLQPNNPFSDVNFLPTISVTRSQSIVVKNYAVLNIAFAGNIVLDTTGLPGLGNPPYPKYNLLVVNTSGAPAAFISCAQLIGGQQVQTIVPGQAFSITWNNLTGTFDVS